MLFIPFNKRHLAPLLPEKRGPQLIFTEPHLFIVFEDISRMFLSNRIIAKLGDDWTDNLTLWSGDIDCRQSHKDEDLLLSEYQYIDFSTLLDRSAVSADAMLSIPFAWDNKALVVNTKFVNALKQAGADFVWYDTFR